MLTLGTLRAIYRYPVKSLRGESLAHTMVNANGLEGDRERALIETAGPRAGKTYRGKEHPTLHLIATSREAIERADGAAPELADPGSDGFFDDAPVSLIIDRWLDDLSDHVQYRVEYQRFRPNFFVEADRDVPTEDALTGRELALGEVIMRVRYPIERCVVPTYDLHGGEADPRILRYLAQERSAWMGIYCDVPRAGIVRIGDSLSLVER
jgi:uncharacterized protein